MINVGASGVGNVQKCNVDAVQVKGKNARVFVALKKTDSVVYCR